MPKVQPFLPWIGGKRRVAERILPLFPEHTCYVEPFCGAAALFFLREEPAKVEVLNDINLDLVTLYRVLQHHLEEFVRQFKWALVSRQMFEWLQATPPATLTDGQKGAFIANIEVEQPSLPLGVEAGNAPTVRRAGARG